MSFLSPFQRAKMYIESAVFPSKSSGMKVYVLNFEMVSLLLFKSTAIYTAARLFHVTPSLDWYSRKIQSSFSIHFLTVLNILEKHYWRTPIVYSDECHYFRLIWALELFFSCSMPRDAASFWHSTPCSPQPCSTSDISFSKHPALYPIQLPATSLLCNLSARSNPKHRLAMTSPGPNHFLHSQKSICFMLTSWAET